MSIETAKQMFFDCAMELIYHSENMSDEQVANKILYVINELDKEKT